MKNERKKRLKITPLINFFFPEVSVLVCKFLPDMKV